MDRLTRLIAFGLVLLVSIHVPSVLSADEGDDLYNLSLGLLRQERYEQAAESLEKLVETYPQHPRTELARFRLGIISLTLKKYDAARKYLRDFVKKNPESKNLPEAMFRIGLSSFQLGEMPAAEKELATFLQKNPEHPSREQALTYLGYAQLQNKKPQEALQTFKTALEAFPKSASREDLLFGEANAYVALQQADEAIGVYRQIAENPTGRRNDQAFMKLGELQFEQQKYAAAGDDYARLATEFPKSPQAPSARMNAGYAYFQGKLYDRAAEQFQTAVKADIQRPTALYWLGLCQKSQGAYEDAAKTLQSAADLVGEVPASAAIRFQWADAELKAGNYQTARKQFLASQKVDPQADTADDSLYLAAETALLMADLDSARSLLDRMRKEYPESGLAGYQQLLRGRIAIGERTPESLEQAETLLRDLLDHPNESLRRQSRFHLARCLETQDRCRDALAALKPLLPQLTKESSQDVRDAWLIAAECHRRLATAAHLEARPIRKQMRAVKNLSGDKPTAELAAKVEELSNTASTEATAALASLKSYYELSPSRRGFADVLHIEAICAALTDNKSQADAALKQLSEGAAEPALAAQILFEVAEIVYDRGRYDWSAELYAFLAAREPAETWQPVAYSGLGWSLYEDEQYAEAATAFGKVVAFDPRNELSPEASFMQGESLLKAGKLPEAQTQFSQTFETYAPEEPTDENSLSGPFAYARRAGLEAARTLKKLDKIEEADRAYELVLERFPQQPTLDLLLSEWAVMNSNAGRFERSDEIFRRLLKTNPNSTYAASARLSLAESAMEAGKFSAARAELKTLLDNESTPADLRKRSLAHLIRIEITAGNWNEVVRLAEDYQSRHPNDSFANDVRFYQAEALINQQQYTDAGKVLEPLYEKRTEPALREAAWFPRLWVLLAEISLQKKDYERVFRLAIEMDAVETTEPFRYQMREVMGRAYKNKARFEDAIGAFEAVTKDKYGEKTETAAKSQFLIGETLMLQKKYKEALEAYLKVYVLYEFPEWQAPALFQAGQCDEALMQWQKALTSYEDLLRDFPNSEFAPQAKQRIADVKRKVK
ncbi:MAG: tetratricopeptide repeat protein [Planctomycetaceae bacterium]|nr:tetratricopeptide repeat protein [Planctomycetaceae bacterium]